MPGIGDQYRIIAEKAGWRRRSERGRLRFTGADRAAFLQALLTNEIASLGPGQGTYAAYLTPQGRMIADLHIFVRAEDIIADVPAGDTRALAETFDRLIFAEDVNVTDESLSLTQVSVIGGSAADLFGRTCGLDPGRLRDLQVWSHLECNAGIVVRTDDARISSYDLLLPIQAGPPAVQLLEAAGAVSASEELYDALRIDAGRPAFGIDMDTDTIPLEAGLLDRAISTTKGCYVGQEVIIRVLHRGGGRVARRLVTLEFAAGTTLLPGTHLRVENRDAGRVTSAASSPDESTTQALAYLRRELAEVGQTVESDTTPPARGVVKSLAG